MAEYNKIGVNYNLNRSADPRIVKRLINFTGVKENAKILDIGAGTGNYTNELADYGCMVDAIEPSQLMIDQAKTHTNVNWFKSSIEAIDLQKNCYDGAISTLAVHHFISLEVALSNIYKALKKNRHFVIFGADPRQIDDNCWLKAYFGNLIDKAVEAYLEISQLIQLLESIFQNKVKYKPFPVPFDVADGFFYAGWQQPEKYLDENFRNNISVFTKAPDKCIQESVEKLALDLKNGAWDKKYGATRNLKVYNGGYYFLKATK
ncbi:hypothetical protein MHTCC0001_24880 [Flavobacteriaceae bacterium MHTCC 0001]